MYFAIIHSMVILLFCMFASTAHAAVKLIVVCQATPRFNGANIEVPLVLYPFGQDVRAVTVSGARTAIDGTTANAQLLALIIARAQAEYTVTLTINEILLKGCFDNNS